MPALIAIDPTLPERVNTSLLSQLASLPTREIAECSLRNGWYCVADVDEAVRLSNEMAPEHLSIHVRDTDGLRQRLTDYGALFVGEAAAEVLGDYGAGPNHTLPTGGAARSFGALSVMDFLRAQTWLRIDNPEASEALVQDTVSLARMEGLEGHARSAELRAVGR